MNKPFSESELWYILHQYTMTGGILHSNNKIIGDMRPRNIFLNQTGDLLIGNRYTFIDEECSYDKAKLIQEAAYLGNYYHNLAPEQLADIRKDKNLTVRSEISEDFAIGLTMLDTILLTNS